MNPIYQPKGQAAELLHQIRPTKGNGMTAIDKDKLITWIARNEFNSDCFTIVYTEELHNAINSGTFDIPEPTVTLLGGSVVKLGERVGCKYEHAHCWLYVKHIIGDLCWLTNGYDLSHDCIKHKENLEAYTDPYTWEKWKDDFIKDINSFSGSPCYIVDEYCELAKKLAGAS